MKLNRVEKALMNNPVRALVQRRHEAALRERLGGRVAGVRVLEIGCGSGVGTEIIFEHFGAREVQAFDVDPDMVARARRRLSGCPANRLTLFVGDVAAIKAEDASYDAVFDFGIIHHVPAWHGAVAEVARVLKPGGKSFFEEVTKHALDRWFYRTFLDHPKTNRFNAEEFIATTISWRRNRSMQNRMKRLRTRIIIILALAAVVLFMAGLLASAEDDEKTVREVLAQSASGFEKGDMAVLNKVWANDESVTVFEQGHANYGWADYRDHHLMPEMKEMKNTKYTLSDIRVKVSGNTAWATFKYAISADIGTRHVDGAGLGTAVLEKRGQDWRIVHWHSSAPRRAPAPAASPTPRP